MTIAECKLRIEILRNGSISQAMKGLRICEAERLEEKIRSLNGDFE